MNLLDKKALNRISEGDIKQFELVFKEYYERLCHFAITYVKNAEQSEGVVQDTFYNIWKNHKTLNITTSLKSYLYAAVRNNCLQELRTRSLDIKYENYYKSHFVNESISPADELNAKELSNVINKALNSLPERCREIFKMSRYEGLKYHEIADKLSISIKTVEANMGKALKQFRIYLKDYAEAV
ncbi:MAG: RNA polymerase sigma-70 factor [Bacteroidales bacterium]|jgi:RNA polymerase sigma-70 factor (ECF subfamily)|nr:RNA polymerase sigma-70 factor [Bacteroidales bacterium]